MDGNGRMTFVEKYESLGNVAPITRPIRCVVWGAIYSRLALFITLMIFFATVHIGSALRTT